MKRTALPAIERFAGLDLDTQPLRAAMTEDGRLTASLARNVVIDQDTGEIVKSPGTVAYHSAVPGGAPPIIGLYEHYQTTGVRTLIARTRTGYYRSNSNRTSWTLMQAEEKRDAWFHVPSFAPLGNYLAIVDGERAYIWDGTSDYLQEWRTGGIEAPRSRDIGSSNQRPASSSAAGTAFSFKRKYELFFTFYNSNDESESPPSRILNHGPSSDANGHILIKTGYAKIGAGMVADGQLGEGQGFWAFPAGVTDVRFYRSDADTPGVWYRVADAAGGSVAIAADDVGDELTTTLTGTDKAAAAAISGWVGPPQGVNVVCSHIQRIFVCGSPQFPNRLWWTNAGELNFDATNFIEVSKPGDPIVGLASFPLETPTLGIFSRNSVWGLAGYDNTTFAAGLRQKASGPGCLAPHAIGVVNGVAYFWGAEGIHKFDGQQVAPIDHGLRRRFLDTLRGLVPTTIEPLFGGFL